LIITLCGSTKFKDDFEFYNKELTLKGHIVLSVGCFGHKDNDERIWANKKMLDLIHGEKINLSQAIFIVNDSHIGESTTKEIKLAKSLGKAIYYPKDFDEL